MWVPASPLNVGRGGLIGATFKTTYAIGGFTTGFGADLASVERFDRGTGKWAPVAPMPTARGNSAAAAAIEWVYVFGGYVGDKPSDIVEVYDPVADAWRSLHPMRTKRGLLKLAVLDGDLYAIGGRDDNAVSQPTVERYDPATDTWQSRAPLLTGRGNPGVAVVDGHIYAVGGQGDGVALRTTERYDPVADRWEKIGPLLATGRSSLSADVVVVDGRRLLIAFGGFELLGRTPVASTRVESMAL